MMKNRSLRSQPDGCALRLSLIHISAAGLAFGLGYYFAVGCALGACPITSNPAASALYGGVMGFLLGYILLPQRWTVRKKADGAEK